MMVDGTCTQTSNSRAFQGVHLPFNRAQHSFLEPKHMWLVFLRLVPSLHFQCLRIKNSTTLYRRKLIMAV